MHHPCFRAHLSTHWAHWSPSSSCLSTCYNYRRVWSSLKITVFECLTPKTWAYHCHYWCWIWGLKIGSPLKMSMNVHGLWAVSLCYEWYESQFYDVNPMFRPLVVEASWRWEVFEASTLSWTSRMEKCLKNTPWAQDPKRSLQWFLMENWGVLNSLSTKKVR